MKGDNLSHGDRMASQIGGPGYVPMIFQWLLLTDSSVTAFHDSRDVIDDNTASNDTGQFCIHQYCVASYKAFEFIQVFGTSA